MPAPRIVELKQIYFSTGEVSLMLNKTDSVIVHTSNQLFNRVRIKRSKGNLRMYTIENINLIYRALYGHCGAIGIKTIERIGHKYQLIFA